MTKQIILTGDRPTGKLHLGHYIGSLMNRVDLQTSYKQYVMIADWQALTDNVANPKKIRDSIFDVLLDYLSVGIDPNQTTIFIQSRIPELAELTMYLLNLVTIARLGRNPTVKEEMRQKGFNDESSSAGFFMYPVSQASDITAFMANLVPVGEDQLPVLELTNEIVRKFNSTYGNVLCEIKPLLSNVPRLPGLNGKDKMSKSLNNCIFLSDDEEVLKQKVMQIYTDPNHIKITDKGSIVGNIVFSYLDAFDKDKNEVAKLKEQYSLGGLGDIKIKNYLFNVLNNLLTPIRNKRKDLINNKDYLYEVINKSSIQAREKVQLNMKKVREAIGLNI